MINIGTTQERVVKAKEHAIALVDLLTKMETALIFNDSSLIGKETTRAFVESTTQEVLETLTYVREHVSLTPNN